MRAEEDADFGPAKFERFTVPGGKNYRELLFTLPSQGFVRGTDGDVRRFHDISHALWTNLSAAQRNELRSEYRKITGGKGTGRFPVFPLVRTQRPRPRPFQRAYRDDHKESRGIRAHRHGRARSLHRGDSIRLAPGGEEEGISSEKDLTPRYRVVSDEKNSMWAVLPEGSEDFIYASAISREDADCESITDNKQRTVPARPLRQDLARIRPEAHGPMGRRERVRPDRLDDRRTAGGPVQSRQGREPDRMGEDRTGRRKRNRYSLHRPKGCLPGRPLPGDRAKNGAPLGHRSRCWAASLRPRGQAR